MDMKLFEDQCEHGKEAYYGQYTYRKKKGDLYFYVNDDDIWCYCHRYGTDGDYCSGYIVHLVYPSSYSESFTKKQVEEMVNDDLNLFNTFCDWRGIDFKNMEK